MRRSMPSQSNRSFNPKLSITAYTQSFPIKKLV
ncbi:hypothetical protein SAMN05216404_11914 [Nitrosospira multiformis]|uniref:Uncharacterized protein n=1 Tax=Nitrosospira multiformis TaxID=1231 RepID=A0A1H8P4N9_9PROT|nr:hypothetical protein SAMN05216404_11914 [Nitrosospira multiformis]